MSAESRTVPLGSVTTWLSGGTPDRANATYWSGSVPWISAATLRTARVHDSDQRITEAAVRAGSKLAPEGATLVLVRGMALRHEVRASLATRPVSFNQDVKALIPKSRILPAYLTYSILARRKAILDLVSSAGSGTGVLDTALLKRLPIWLPEAGEQQKIIEAIDDSGAFCDSLERAIAKKQAMKQGMMQQLLTGRTRLPGFTVSWPEVRLGGHVDYMRSAPLSRAQLDNESPLRYLHYGDIHAHSSVRLDVASEPMPRVAASFARSAGRLREGDLVFADASEDIDGVGKSVEITSVPPEGVIPGLHTIAARFDDQVLADGFKAYLQFIPDFRNQLLRLAAGTKVLATTRSYISSITIKLPTVDEQRAIAVILAEADQEIDTLRLRLAKARDIKQGMMQELLTGRTRLAVQE